MVCITRPRDLSQAFMSAHEPGVGIDRRSRLVGEAALAHRGGEDLGGIGDQRRSMADRRMGGWLHV